MKQSKKINRKPGGNKRRQKQSKMEDQQPQATINDYTYFPEQEIPIMLTGEQFETLRYTMQWTMRENEFMGNVLSAGTPEQIMEGVQPCLTTLGMQAAQMRGLLDSIHAQNVENGTSYPREVVVQQLQAQTGPEQPQETMPGIDPDAPMPESEIPEGRKEQIAKVGDMEFLVELPEESTLVDDINAALAD